MNVTEEHEASTVAQLDKLRKDIINVRKESSIFCTRDIHKLNSFCFTAKKIAKVLGNEL